MSLKKGLVGQVSNIVKEFIRAERMPRDHAERAFEVASEHARALPRDGILEALDRATRGSRSLQRGGIYFLCELYDVPGAVERIANELQHPDPAIRSLIVQTIGFREMRGLAPLLNAVILEDPDELCRVAAIDAAGRLKQDANLEAILRVAGDPSVDGAVISALAMYARKECRPYLRAAFDRPIGAAPSIAEMEDVNNPDAIRRVQSWSVRRNNKLFAAWGLARLGDIGALKHLGEMLYDPERRGRNVWEPGLSVRAAEAIADVCVLPFSWDPGSLAAVRLWWEENRERALCVRG